MRKLTLLSAFILILSSCGSDDDNNTIDPFVGTWTLTKKIDNGQEEVLTDCDLQETYIVYEDGTFVYKDYDTNATDDCYLVDEENGVWQLLSSGDYRLTYNPDTIEEDIEDYVIVFSGNTLTITGSDDSDNDSEVFTKQ